MDNATYFCRAFLLFLMDADIHHTHFVVTVLIFLTPEFVHVSVLLLRIVDC